MGDNVDGSFTELIDKIHQWGKDRQIHENSSGLAQSRKTLEEAGELIEAMAKVDLCREFYEEAQRVGQAWMVAFSAMCALHRLVSG